MQGTRQGSDERDMPIIADVEGQERCAGGGGDIQAHAAPKSNVVVVINPIGYDVVTCIVL